MDSTQTGSPKALRGLQEPLLGPHPNTVQIPLTRGMVAVVDAEDFQLVSTHTWTASFQQGRWYARTQLVALHNPSRQTTMGMHQLILGKRNGMLPDHANRNGLDNRRLNLRFSSHAQNSQNRKVRAENKLGLKGVRKVTNGSTFQASITVNRKRRFIGSFRSAIDAALAYDAAARNYFGEFAVCNFPSAISPAIPTPGGKEPHA